MIVPRSRILTLALAAASCGGGATRATLPPLPPSVVVERGPCLTAPPPAPPPSLAAIPEAGPIGAELADALLAYVEVLERRVLRDWRLCGPRAVRP